MHCWPRSGERATRIDDSSPDHARPEPRRVVSRRIVGETYFETVYPPGLHFSGDTTGPPEVDALFGLRAPFYAWTSIIEDGRVVATDYAPDVGWLDPSAEANR